MFRNRWLRGISGLGEKSWFKFTVVLTGARPSRQIVAGIWLSPASLEATDRRTPSAMYADLLKWAGITEDVLGGSAVLLSGIPRIALAAEELVRGLGAEGIAAEEAEALPAT